MAARRPGGCRPGGALGHHAARQRRSATGAGRPHPVADAGRRRDRCADQRACALLLLQNAPHVVRMFPDYPATEADYLQRTRIFPIMHAIGIRRSLLDRHPWLAVSFDKAFLQAKKALCLHELGQIGHLYSSLPWGVAENARIQRTMGPDHRRHPPAGHAVRCLRSQRDGPRRDHPDRCAGCPRRAWRRRRAHHRRPGSGAGAAADAAGLQRAGPARQDHPLSCSPARKRPMSARRSRRPPRRKRDDSTATDPRGREGPADCLPLVPEIAAKC